MHISKSSLFIIPLFLFLFSSADAQENSLTISDWLILGPVESQLPVYHDQKNIQDKTFTLTDLLSFEPVDVSGWHSEEGKRVDWSQTFELEWEAQSGEILELETADEENPQNYWTAFYLTSDRFTEATLEIKNHHPFKLYINGSEKASKTASEKEDADAGSHSEKLALTRGKHLVMIRSLYDHENNADFTLSATASWNGEASLTQSLSPIRTLDLETLSNQPSVNNLAISANGSLTAMRINKPSPPDGDGESWLEIRETETGDLYREYKGTEDFGNLQWAPEGLKFTYTESDEGKTTIWLSDLETGSQQKLLEDVSDFGSYR